MTKLVTNSNSYKNIEKVSETFCFETVKKQFYHSNINKWSDCDSLRSHQSYLLNHDAGELLETERLKHTFTKKLKPKDLPSFPNMLNS